MVLIDSYSEANMDNNAGMWDNHPSDSEYLSAIGQSFTMLATNHKITSCKFHICKYGNPTGNGHAVLYAHSGVYGTSSVPTGAALATSNDFDVSTLPSFDTFQLTTFTFSDAQQYQMVANAKYVIVFQEPSSGISYLNAVCIGHDASSPSHGGNRTYYANGAWAADNTKDVPFYVYGDPVASVVPIMMYHYGQMTKIHRG